jgi:hypothetical protein
VVCQISVVSNRSLRSKVVLFLICIYMTHFLLGSFDPHISALDTAAAVTQVLQDAGMDEHFGAGWAAVFAEVKRNLRCVFFLHVFRSVVNLASLSSMEMLC